MKVTIERSAKQWFFDREKVIRRVERTRRGAMAKMGDYVRDTARNSIKKRKTSSQPGQPPHSHTGLLKNQIWFAYDPAADSVVIGPVAFRRSDVPQALEFGGTVRVKKRVLISQTNNGKTKKGRDRVKRGDARIYSGPLKIKARPYMGPALIKSKTALPDIWEKAITK